jgi:hypothetical protein
MTFLQSTFSFLLGLYGLCCVLLVLLCAVLIAANGVTHWHVPAEAPKFLLEASAIWAVCHFGFLMGRRAN